MLLKTQIEKWDYPALKNSSHKKPKIMKKSTLLLMLIMAVISTQAQDIQISFKGIGASSTVDSVKVVNVTQGTTVTISGNDVLTLPNTPTGIKPKPEATGNSLHIYPNPMTESSTIEFKAASSGSATIELFDITGKRVAVMQSSVSIGINCFKISGLERGIYLLQISSKDYSYSGKLLSTNTTHTGLNITYEGSNTNSSPKLKSAEDVTALPYNAGDLIHFYGTSGIYVTIVAIIPTQSMVITFSFVACTDADGNNYPVVQIGSQIWMAENLKTTKYRNGDPINNVTDNTAWAGSSTGAWCFNNNVAGNAAVYGRLYNNYAASDSRNISPVGWHLPTDAEWTKLTTFLGGAIAGGKLKETGTTHWRSPNTGATNETGFTALPGNLRNQDGSFGIYGYGSWWSSSKSDIDTVWSYNLSPDYYVIARVRCQYKQVGLSIRCVMDEVVTQSPVQKQMITMLLHLGIPVTSTKSFSLQKGDILEFSFHDVYNNTNTKMDVNEAESSDGETVYYGTEENLYEGAITNLRKKISATTIGLIVKQEVKINGSYVSHETYELVANADDTVTQNQIMPDGSKVFNCKYLPNSLTSLVRVTEDGSRQNLIDILIVQKN